MRTVARFSCHKGDDRMFGWNRSQQRTDPLSNQSKHNFSPNPFIYTLPRVHVTCCNPSHKYITLMLCLVQICCGVHQPEKYQKAISYALFPFPGRVSLSIFLSIYREASSSSELIRKSIYKALHNETKIRAEVSGAQCIDFARGTNSFIWRQRRV